MTRMVDNILMIVSDTVRWDYLGRNGGRARTPNLDRLAERSIVFDNYHATSFPTVPARFDYLTGKASFIEVGWGPLDRNEYSITGDLSAAGYTLLGVVDTPFYRAQGFHYDRGFHYFYDMMTQPLGTPAYHLGARYDATQLGEYPLSGKLLPEPRISEFDHAAPKTMAQAEKCLEYLYQRPFFALVDTWDPHEPWNAPEYYVRHYLSDYEGERVHPPYTRWADADLTERDLEIARANYCGKLEMVDRAIGGLLDKVERLGIADRTAIVFVSDHGFYFGEHGYLGKMVRRVPGERAWYRSPLYRELTHVPLFVHLPGAAPRRIDELASALDIAPTLLDLAGQTPPKSMAGRSLRPQLEATRSGRREAVISAMPLTNLGEQADVVDSMTRTILAWQPITLMDNEWTFLYSVPEEAPELYAAADTAQVDNVADKHPDVVERLRDQLLVELKRLGASEEYLKPRRPAVAASVSAE